MPHYNRLLLPFAAAALLSVSGTAHAGPLRAAQSLPISVRIARPVPAPLRTVTPAKTSRDQLLRASLARSGGRDRADAANRGRGDRGRFDNRRYDHDRDGYERAKEREGRKFERHERDDSPGC
jgi:hypothetical protein